MYDEDGLTSDFPELDELELEELQEGILMYYGEEVLTPNEMIEKLETLVFKLKFILKKIYKNRKNLLKNNTIYTYMKNVNNIMNLLSLSLNLLLQNNRTEDHMLL